MERWSRRQCLAALAAGALPLRTAAEPEAPFGEALDRAWRTGQLHSLVIAQRGRIAAAAAFRGPGLDRPANVKSVSKSLVSALAGIAIDRGELSGTGQHIAPLLGRWVPRRADARVHAITVDHLLSMRSGLQVTSGEAYGDWVTERHWIYAALSKPMIADPGTAMLYSTASYHILGALLSEVSGQDLHALAQARIGAPLGLEIPPWTRDPHGRYLGGNDMKLSPLGLLRFGECCRQGGVHGATRVIPADWIETSWQPRGRSEETGHGYGYGWYLWRARGHEIVYARGYGGQMIYIVPDVALTVAITSDPRRPAPVTGHLGALNRLLTEAILPEAEATA